MSIGIPTVCCNIWSQATTKIFSYAVCKTPLIDEFIYTEMVDSKTVYSGLHGVHMTQFTQSDWFYLVRGKITFHIQTNKKFQILSYLKLVMDAEEGREVLRYKSTFSS